MVYLRYFLGISLILSAACAHRQKTAESEMKAGHARAEAHDWTGALKHFSAATKKDPQLASAWSNRGTALLNLGRPEQAMKSYRRAEKIDPENSYLYCSMASAEHALGQPEKALKHADKAIELDPEYAPALANKAKALEALGKGGQAALLFERAFEMMPQLRNHFKPKP